MPKFKLVETATRVCEDGEFSEFFTHFDVVEAENITEGYKCEKLDVLLKQSPYFLKNGEFKNWNFVLVEI